MQHDFIGSPVAQDYGDLLGTPFKVFLSNGVVEKRNSATGKVAIDIVDLPGLIASIVQSRVLHPRKLSGDDLKYIRSALGLRSVDVANVLEISPEHYSRCEAGTKTLSVSSEKHLRMHVFLAAAWKHTEVQKQIAKNAKCDPEEAKEALEAFNKIFSEMKIQHLFPADEGLEFSFSRKSRRDDEKIADCGKDDGKWRKDPIMEAA
jgi:hypothetical protein